MTTITVYTSADGAVRGFLASGHAGGKKIRGYDLVCCAADISGASCRGRLTPGGWKKRRSCSKRS